MGQNWLSEELKRLKEERKKRRRAGYVKSKEEQEEDFLQVVNIAVRAGIFCLGGLSICFSTFLIPGLVPFLGGLICGVSLIEPPALPHSIMKDGDDMNTTSKDDGNVYAEDREVGGEDSNVTRRNNKHSTVMKQVVLNFVEHFF